jgi:hypothetical protein
VRQKSHDRLDTKEQNDIQRLVTTSLEQSLVEGDYALLSVLREYSPDQLRLGMGRLESLITNWGADKDLEDLCLANCAREEILWLLHWFPKKAIFHSNDGWLDKPGVKTTKALLGLTPGQLRGFVSHLNKIAIRIELVNHKFEFGVLLATSKQLFPLWHLQRLVRAYAALLQDAARHFAGGSHIYHNVAKARLTTYVLHKTGDYHDKEVAALISSVSEDAKFHYDDTAHRMWRKKHYQRLRMIDPLLLKHGPMAELC